MLTKLFIINFNLIISPTLDAQLRQFVWITLNYLSYKYGKTFLYCAKLKNCASFHHEIFHSLIDFVL